MWRTVAALPLLLPLAWCGVLYFQPLSLEVVPCGNSSGQSCADGQTCCLQANGYYSCCDLYKATCCEDKIHCCPQGYKCDISRGTCVQGSRVLRQVALSAGVPPRSKTGQAPASTQPSSIECPDHETYCEDDCTCCWMASQRWGCCPMPQAVCCSDGIHCCPHGSTCDLVHEACVSTGRPSIPFRVKEPGLTLTEVGKSLGQSIPCDQDHMCNDSCTCCRMTNGDWGCCPEQNAVCCADHVHCCPQGSKCDTSHNSLQCVKDHQQYKPSCVTPAQKRKPPVTSGSDDVTMDKDGPS